MQCVQPLLKSRLPDEYFRTPTCTVQQVQPPMLLQEQENLRKVSDLTGLIQADIDQNVNMQESSQDLRPTNKRGISSLTMSPALKQVEKRRRTFKIRDSSQTHTSHAGDGSSREIPTDIFAIMHDSTAYESPSMHIYGTIFNFKFPGFFGGKCNFKPA